MSFKVLYRKLRPDKFDAVIGQPHIVKTLVNQINTGHFSHAYLFCGTRGTGKTTTAKIFAKAINCENPENGSPCGVCASCKAIEEIRSMNVLEIDAASNNGVDNIRDIRDEVKYAPTEGKFKVYIIDEVHMLTPGAFNALLKTLEEPPPHVIFILATTDPQKIPQTVLSRVTRFDFRRISAVQMVETMKEYMESEKIDVEEAALLYIATSSDGAMRDALSVLDQCIAFHFDKSITLEDVLAITGAVDNQFLFDITDKINEFNAYECLKIIDEITLLGKDIFHVTTDLIVHLRNLIVIESAPDSSQVVVASPETRAKLMVQAKSLSKSKIISFINIFSKLHQDMRYAQNKRALFEVVCISLCNPQTAEKSDVATENLLERLKKLEADMMNGVKIVNQSEPTPPSQKATRQQPKIEKQSPKTLS